MSTPIHPAVVHVPLGLSIAIPVVALGLMLWSWRGGLVRGAWLVVIALQIVVVGGAVLALRTGESDEERVERIVGERPLEAHEAAGKQFLMAAAAALLVFLIVPLPRVPHRAALVLAVAVSLAAAAMAIRAGKGGGELVYVHGAAQANVPSGARAADESVTPKAAEREQERP